MVGGRGVVAAAIGLGVAPAAMAATGVAVSSVSSLKGSAGTLTGRVVNDTGKLTHARITVSLHKRGTTRAPSWAARRPRSARTARRTSGSR